MVKENDVVWLSIPYPSDDSEETLVRIKHMYVVYHLTYDFFIITTFKPATMDLLDGKFVVLEKNILYSPVKHKSIISLKQMFRAEGVSIKDEYKTYPKPNIYSTVRDQMDNKLSAFIPEICLISASYFNKYN
ncbi:MAG: hypothetical protein ABF755_00980 [Oenococcus oeni]